MEIITFWKQNPQFWISIENQKEADQIIYERFKNYDLSNENLFGLVIYLDQFLRHFSRIDKNYTEDILIHYRNIAKNLILDNISLLYNCDEIELLFSLMVFKHLKEYKFIFDFIHNKWTPLNGKPIKDFKYLHKFYIDTYKKSYFNSKDYNLETTHKSDVEFKKDQEYKYNADEICDYFETTNLSELYEKCKNIIQIYPKIFQTLYDVFSTNKSLLVSLSGGVDSMVMLTLLKIIKDQYLQDDSYEIIAVHIIYGNRKVSEQEYNFLCEFCSNINVKLYSYQIEYLRRDQVEREFYETMTRIIRFNVYDLICKLNEKEYSVLLGHIKDDIIENIWTNIVKCQHLDNLKKMKFYDNQMGVKLCRPFLDVDKKSIYEISNILCVSYLKNTTPSWSNRGKFRERFYQETIIQFGETSDKLIELSEFLEKQFNIIDKIIYEPILRSLNVINESLFSLDITRSIESDLDAKGYYILFDKLFKCIKNIKLMPSVKSITEFTNKLKNNQKDSFRFNLKKNLFVYFEKKENSSIILFKIC